MPIESMTRPKKQLDDKQRRAVKLTDPTAKKGRTLCADVDDQAVPAPNGGRVQAPECGIDLRHVTANWQKFHRLHKLQPGF